MRPLLEIIAKMPIGRTLANRNQSFDPEIVRSGVTVSSITLTYDDRIKTLVKVHILRLCINCIFFIVNTLKHL